MFWFLLGVLLVLLIHNHFNMQGVAKDLRGIAKTVRKLARGLARTIRNAMSDTKKEAVPAEAPTAQDAVLPDETEQYARTAAMLANVPTIAFPEDDPKYDSSRKCRYA